MVRTIVVASWLRGSGVRTLSTALLDAFEAFFPAGREGSSASIVEIGFTVRGLDSRSELEAESFRFSGPSML